MRRRTLGDVFHYFISEEEQQEAREDAGAAGRRSDANVAARRAGDGPEIRCWWISADPARPLSCTVVLDLTVASLRSGVPTRVLASFPPHPLIAEGTELCWESIAPDGQGELALAHRLAAKTDATRTFVVLAPTELGPTVRQLAEGSGHGVLVLVEATPEGPVRALSTLRELVGSAPELRIGAAVVGASDPLEAHALFSQVERAAHRQFGLVVEDLGWIERGRASIRSLLHGLSVLEVDADSSCANSVRALSDRLASPALSAA